MTHTPDQIRAAIARATEDLRSARDARREMAAMGATDNELRELDAAIATAETAVAVLSERLAEADR